MKKIKQKHDKETKILLERIIQDTEFEQMYELMQDWPVNITCLSDTCVAWEKSYTKNIQHGHETI